MAEKFSIPQNYEIKKVGNLVGIVRNDKKGSKWIWEPFYNLLFVAKSYGKILVAYREATSQANYLRISSYNKKEQLPINVYDMLFGENCLYVRVVNSNTQDLEWALVNEDFSGLKFIGDFEVLDRASNPFYIPIGKTEMRVQLEDGTEKKLKLMTGELTEAIIKKPEVIKPVEEPLKEYKVVFNEENKKIQLLGRNDRVVKESIAIGELEQYSALITAMIGGTNVIPVSTGDLLIDFLSNFEYCVHGIILPILYTYEKDRTTTKKTLDERLKDMIKELNSNWFKWDNREFKVYIQGTIFTVLMRENTGIGTKRIVVAAYMLEPSNNILTNEELENLLKLYQVNKIKTTRLDIKDIELAEVITDRDEIAEFQSPYSVRQRLDMVKTIKSFTYESIKDIRIKCNMVEEATKNVVGPMEIEALICEKFRYVTKVRGKKTDDGEVSTNITALKVG